MRKFGLNCALVIGLCLAASIAWADSLELKNGSLIKGKFMGGTESEISFQVGSSVQKYNLADIVALKFDSERSASDMPARPSSTLSNDPEAPEHPSMKAPASVTIPAGTRISVRMIDSIDSTKNHLGDRFQASLEEPLMVDGSVVAPKGTNLYGQLAESKESGTFTGRSQLRLETHRDRDKWTDYTGGDGRVRIAWKVAWGEHCEEDGWRGGGRIDHRCTRWQRQRRCGRRECRWPARSRVGGHHQGRPSEGAERDPS